MSFYSYRIVHKRISSGTNNIEQERSINALYLGRAENDSGYIVFKLDTKAVVSVNRVVVIPTLKTVIDRVNGIRISEKQPEGVKFTDRDGRVSINDLNLNLDNDNDNDSNASNESFDHDKEYQDEFDREGKDEDLATNKVQDNHFQLPFQQYHALLIDKPS